MVQIRSKDPTKAASYRPRRLLPVASKLFEKLLLTGIKECLLVIIPDDKFRFWEQHSLTELINWVVQVIDGAFERKQHCSSEFFCVCQAFD